VSTTYNEDRSLPAFVSRESTPSGCFRQAVLLGDYVYKFAINQSGAEMNRAEWDAYRADPTLPLAACYYLSDSGYLLVQERVQPLGTHRSLSPYCDCGSRLCSTPHPALPVFTAAAWALLTAGLGVEPKPASFGRRPGTGKVVAFDYGDAVDTKYALYIFRNERMAELIDAGFDPSREEAV
jgi:hypothetical protein